MASTYNELFGLGTYAIDADLEGWWKCQETGGSIIAADSSGNSRMLQLGVSASALTTTGPIGRGFLPNAFDFGTTSSGTISDSTLRDLPATHLMTVLVRCKAGAAASSGESVWSWSGVDDLLLYNNDTNAGTGGPRLFWRDLGGNIINVSGTDDEGTWTDFAFVTDGSASHRLYQDGALVGSSTDSGSSGPFSSIRFGNSSVGENSTAADFVIFGRDLTVAEINEWRLGPEPLAPGTIGAPTGTTTEDEVLTAVTGTWDTQLNGTVSYSYQWVRANDGAGTGAVDIGGATSSTYTLVAADVGKYIACRISASNLGGSDSAEDTLSDFTTVVAGLDVAIDVVMPLGSGVGQGVTLSAPYGFEVTAPLGSGIGQGVTLDVPFGFEVVAPLGSGTGQGAALALVAANSLTLPVGPGTGQGVTLDVPFGLNVSAMVGIGSGVGTALTVPLGFSMTAGFGNGTATGVSPMVTTTAPVPGSQTSRLGVSGIPRPALASTASESVSVTTPLGTGTGTGITPTIAVGGRLSLGLGTVTGTGLAPSLSTSGGSVGASGSRLGLSGFPRPSLRRG